MYIDENGCRHYSSVDEGRQYVDAIESMGIDDEARRHQQEGQAMTDDERGRVERVARAIFDVRSDGILFFGNRTPDSVFASRRMWYVKEAEAAIAAMREGEQKQEGEARAADVPKRGEDGYEYDRLKAQRAEMERRERGKTAAGFINACTDLCKALCSQLEQRAEAAESLAKVEREGRESEAVAYKKEIEGLREDVEVADAVAKMAAHDRDEALAQLTDAKATIAHWKHLACDPQTRENINAEKVAECERLRAALEKIVAHEVAYDRGEAFTATEAREALAGRTGT